MTQAKKLTIQLAISIFIGLSGSFLLIGENSDWLFPALGYFIWNFIILGLVITWLKIQFNKLDFNILSTTFLISYILLTFGFIINTKQELANIFWSFILLALFSIHAIDKSFSKKIVQKYLNFGLVFCASFAAGWLIFFIEFLNSLFKPTEHDQKIRKKTMKVKQKRESTIKAYLHSKSTQFALKNILVFLVTGLPIIALIVKLLSLSNENFADFIGRFSINLDLSLDFLGIWFIRLPFAALVAIIYLCFLFSFLLNNKAKQLYIDTSAGISNTGRRIYKYALSTGFGTITILNLFFIVFVYFELGYDINNVRESVLEKGFDSYSAFAVSRFWELIMVSLINFTLVYFLFSHYRRFQKISRKLPKDSKQNFAKFVQIFTLTNLLFLFVNTLLLVFSVYRRLSLYIEGYGFTDKRFSAYLLLPILIIVTSLVFARFIFPKFKQSVSIAFAVLVLFMSIYTTLPTTYMINRINLNLAKQGKIVVYDPIYSIELDRYQVQRYNNKSYTNGEDESISINRSNDIKDYDGVLITQEILRTDEIELTNAERTLLEEFIQDFKNRYSGYYYSNELQTGRNTEENTNWRNHNPAAKYYLERLE